MHKNIACFPSFQIWTTMVILIKWTPTQKLGKFGAQFLKAQVFYKKTVNKSISI